jgi:hypothetical protein
LSEQVVEDLEEDETPSVPEDDGEQSQEDTAEEQVADDAAKLRKALERARRDLKAERSKHAETRKKASEGQDLGETEKLTRQVAELAESLQRTNAVAALLEAGFNGSKAQAERMLRMVDDLGDMDTAVEELKVDFPQHFGKRGARPDGQRPYSGGGRDDTRGKQMSAEERHAAKLMGTYRRS